MKRKVIAVLTASLMAFSMTACGGGGDKNTAGGTEAGAGDAGNAAASGEVTHLVMSFPTWTGAPADTQQIQDAMNEITRESLGIEVELQISDFGSYNQNMTLALSGGEQIDILSTVGFSYSNAVMQGYLLDLEENDLLSTYGAGIVEAVGEKNVEACRIDGTLYGLPNNRDFAAGYGCAAIATQYLDGIGYEVDKDAEIIRITEEELDEIYAQLHAQYPDKEVYRPVLISLQQFSDYDPLGGSAFGVLLDYGKELKVENLFTSETYYNYCERMYNFNQMGYISKDAATDTTAVGELVKAGSLMSYTTAGKPGIKAQESSLCGQDMTIFQTKENFVSSTSVAGMPWAIPLTTTDAGAAMRYLNELYTNPDLQNLLAWGIEGTHYVIGEDGLATYPDGVDASNSGYNHSMGWMMPNQFITHIWQGNSPTLWDDMRTFNETAKVSAASGFTFDPSNVANEVTAVQNVYNEYEQSLEFGFVDPATGIEEMNQKMMDAGLQKIIDEKQTQLDEWAANK